MSGGARGAAQMRFPVPCSCVRKMKGHAWVARYP